MRIQLGKVLRVDRYEALSLLLVEGLLFVHAHLVLGCVESPILDVDVQFGQIEVRADLKLRDDAVFVVVAV